MDLSGYYYVGRIVKSIGIKGAVSALLDVDDPEEYTQMESVYVKINAQLIPFFIESLETRHNNQAIIKFEDIDTVEQTEILVNCEMYLPLEVLPELDDTRFYYHEIKGFNVRDEKKGDIGRVVDVLEYPNQAIIQVQFGEKEILIPVHDDIILKVDRVSSMLYIRAPEGLIDLYLE